MASEEARQRYARKNEQDELERAFRTIDKDGDARIDAEELNQLFKALGHKPVRGEAEDMIWEVDDDCDGCVSWLEFQTMYTRGRDDKTGYEPRGLFNVVEFVMNDKDGCGFISLEEAMQIMYLRYGRAQLDYQLEEIFGTCDLNSGKLLTLTEFLHCLKANQVKQLLNRVTAKNYKAPPPATKVRK
uniref:EF-hand domain-containing protein n=1 Tax=Chlamydomonas euryale TaxID=1486919 RepID=A0A7R9VD05_9CHLO|mmetsp:Transcript_30777/g.91462  ORF Transcript_30777/g.91462 Transcript_30777/m.91462 type:complete len:186 (+) Transcript_30777:375-932(+)